MATTEHGVTGEIAYPAPKRAPYEGRDFTIIGIAAAAAAVCALAANLLNLPRLQPLTGLIVILAIAYCFSTNRRAIDMRTVAWGLGLQILFALIVLKTAIGQQVFKSLAAVSIGCWTLPSSDPASSSARSATRTCGRRS